MAKVFQIEVEVLVISKRRAVFEVESGNATKAKGIAEYLAENESDNAEWALSEDEFKTLRSKVVGVNSSAS